mmetsp:Transcript_10778/g.20006  ORF Transcript_10778/g.20006 Transcript_10778/m.20006 type:complete len:479 (-) Transcript_10778:79-1515(-)
MPEFELHEAFKEPGVDTYKKRGNDAFKEGNWDEALKNYNKAITLDPSIAALYSNRAAVHSSKGNHDSALSDANRCIERDPTFLKGYSRKGKALFDMNQMDEAEAAYKQGLAVDPANDGCSKGVADIKAIREAVRRAAAQNSPLGQAKTFMSKVGEKMKKGGIGGRLQMYMLLFGGYFMYKKFMNTSGAETTDQKTQADTDDDYRASSSGAVAKWQRGFSENDGTWLSYLESSSQGESMLLMLHSTSGTANSEYGKILSQLIEKPLPSTGFRVLLPDRPCHGYSPCPSNGEPKDGAKWMNNLLADRGQPKRLALVASGREAATYMLALVRRRKKAASMLLVRPQLAAPGRGTLTSASDISKWLEKQHGSKATAPKTAKAAADAAWWAAKEVSDDPEEQEQIKVGPMPNGCTVSILYAADDDEDEDLKNGLEEQGVKVTVQNSAGSGDTLLEEVAQQARQLLTSKDSDTDPDEEELDDRL